MSRTYKDRPWKIRFPESDPDFGYYKLPFERERKRFNKEKGYYEPTGEYYTSFVYMHIPGIKLKKRKDCDTVWHWTRGTPSWWTRMMMNKPQRRRGKLWERKVLVEDLEETDPPMCGRKPHMYYW